MKFKIRYKSNSNLINTTDAESWISNNVRVDEDGKEGHPRADKCLGKVCYVLQLLQIMFFFVLLCGFAYIIKMELFSHPTHRQNAPKPIELIGQPDIPSFNRRSLTNPPHWRLLDLEDFRLLKEPHSDFCKVDKLLFLLVVHSKPDHFRQRQAVRSTWGSLQQFKDDDDNDWSTRTVFILGNASETDNSQPFVLGQTVSDLIHQENIRYGDIVIGSFQDEYHNLVYKNVLGLRWASDRCSNAIFFLKADDDAFVNVLGLQQYLARTFSILSQEIKDVLAGNVFPSGTSPQRNGKWAVSTTEYPWSEYPSYLGGLAYFMTPDVATDLHKVAHTNKVPQVWVDDVWVTGLLSRSLDLKPILLNPQYSYDHQEMSDWVKNISTKPQSHIHPPPFTFAHLDPTVSDWQNTYQQLWTQVLLANNMTVNGEKILKNR